ncbi:hypothetical protein JMN32_20060 [Fulvivirga sp. 29W222]|uniref:Uncharacterized protein n=1 Tax=Fulvivirga marina TaxID=2494733 RepID=A0A937G144_9BACT|nr:HEXXH motif-containing putative peptide modification protein [Fulvivirga marina]MBL6448617.1 hypothetical protein [Fulvivirga marina]
MIAWDKIAFPQPDHYDLEVIKRLKDTSLIRPKVKSTSKVLFTCFDNRVAVGHYHHECPYSGMYNHTPEDVMISKSIDYLLDWPEMKEQFPFFVSFINPIQLEFFESNPFGSSSGCHWDEPGLIYLTTNDPFPLAEAMVHEMAHLKLFSLGITMNSASEWISNPAEAMYYSSIKDTERPMAAVLHAQYSFIHILYLDLILLKKYPTHQDHETWKILTNDTLKRMQTGQEVLERNIKPTKLGEPFIESFLSWSKDTIAKGRAYFTPIH